MYYNEQLKELQQQTARKKRVEAMVKELNSQQSQLKEKVKELKNIKIREQVDVDKLEERSLANLFYTVLGKKDEKLEKERAEAYAAVVKYDAAVKELESVECDIRKLKRELCDLQYCQQNYEKLLQEKKEAIKMSGSVIAGEILQLEEQVQDIESQKKELEEARVAGRMAYSAAERVYSKLEEAENMGVWDMVGGGILATMAKHEKLDEAQERIEELQSRLRQFKTELTDVTIQADMQVSVEGFLRTADYLFDGFFVDWEVLDRIKQSKEQVAQTENQIENMLGKLDTMKQTVEKRQEAIKKQLDELVVQAG